jgi:GTP-binding protein EngB required for normal cell division
VRENIYYTPHDSEPLSAIFQKNKATTPFTREDKSMNEVSVSDAPLPEESKQEVNDSLEYPINLIRKVCVFLGKIGAGKSTVYKCLTLDGSCEPPRGLQKVNSEIRHIDQLVGHFELSVWDTPGFQGVSKADDKELWLKFLDHIKVYDAFVNSILVCFSAEHFTNEDEAIISFIRDKLSPEVHAVVTIVVTNCREWNIETVISDVKDKLGFLGDLEHRLFLLDLVDANHFSTGAAREECIRNWEDQRGVLQSHIREAEQSITVEDLQRHTSSACILL